MKPFRFAAVPAVALTLWAFWIEPATLVERTTRVELAEWPGECAGLRIAVLADLHVGSPFNGIPRLEDVVERTNALAPDLVLVTGDLVIHGVIGGSPVAPEQIAQTLGGLRSPLGAYAVLGNHDHWLDGPRIAAALEDAGIPVLENRSRRLTHSDCPIWLVGIADAWEGPPDLTRAFAGVDLPSTSPHNRSRASQTPIIAFTHNPDVFPELPAGVDLGVAGHTHGGQVALPGIGRPIVPSRFGERFAVGLVTENDRRFFISPGVGTSILPVRFRVPPEISILELSRRDPSPSSDGSG